MLQITLLTMARLKCLNEWCMILKAFFYLFFVGRRVLLLPLLCYISST